jgi:hypothetical protein
MYVEILKTVILVIGNVIDVTLTDNCLHRSQFVYTDNFTIFQRENMSNLPIGLESTIYRTLGDHAYYGCGFTDRNLCRIYVNLTVTQS